MKKCDSCDPNDTAAFLTNKKYTRSYGYSIFYPNRSPASYKCKVGENQKLAVSFDFRPSSATYHAYYNQLYMYVYTYKRVRYGNRYRYQRVDFIRVSPFGSTSPKPIANKWNGYSKVFDITCGYYSFVYLSTASRQTTTIDLDNFKLSAMPA